MKSGVICFEITVIRALNIVKKVTKLIWDPNIH